MDSINSEAQLLAVNGINTEDNSGNTLIFYCMENKNYHPLHHFFDSINDTSNLFRTSVGVSLYDSLLKSKNPVLFFKNFSNNRYIREYLLEKLHDPQFRISNYEKAYIEYLEDVENHKNGAGLQDYIFGNSVLFRYYFLNNRGDDALKLGKKIFGEFPSLEPYVGDIFIFPFIRFTAYKLWFLKISTAHPIELDDYAFYLLDLCSRLKPKCDFEARQILFHTVAESFLNCPEIHTSFHWDLKDIFSNDFAKIPDLVFSKHLKYSLPYFDNNGLHNYRP